ncbi:hypothetical protein V1506DRAFT_405580 [Lipomyces tetrasporus]
MQIGESVHKRAPCSFVCHLTSTANLKPASYSSVLYDTTYISLVISVLLALSLLDVQPLDSKNGQHQRCQGFQFQPQGENTGHGPLFVGGTSGIGKGTLRQLAKCANAPKVYIVGRSMTFAAPLLSELESLNPLGTFIFIETEISLIKNVDTVCAEKKRKERNLDLVFLSAGYLSVAGRQETSEGIDTFSSVAYYGRLRIIDNFLPLLSASVSPRVIPIFNGGKESTIDLHDLELRNSHSFTNAINLATTQTTLAFEELAKVYPMVNFCHVHPGFVTTGILDRLTGTVKGIWRLPAILARWTVVPVVQLFGMSIDETGEWGVFVATSAKYPPAEPKHPHEVGVALPDGVDVAKSSVVKDGKGNGVYRIDSYGESVENECDRILADYRADQVEKKVWEETMSVWARALKRGEPWKPLIPRSQFICRAKLAVLASTSSKFINIDFT